MEWTLAANALVGSVAAGFFLSMALRLRDSAVSAEAKPAVALFSVWWMGLAVYAIAGASVDLASSVGFDRLEIVVAADYMQKFSLCIGLWGLMYYLAYILTGSKRLMVPLALFYSLYYAVILFFVTTGRPSAVAVQPWRTRLLYQMPILDQLTATSLLVIPPIVAAGTYLVIFTRATDRTARYRTIALATATIVWSVSLVARESNVLAALPAFLALGSAFAARWAYAPPKWIAERVAAA